MYDRPVGWDRRASHPMLTQSRAEIACRRKTMNVETLAIEDQEPLSADQAEDASRQQTAEITPLALESFKLIGGGSGIVVF
jgi:hypothetical protein